MNYIDKIKNNKKLVRLLQAIAALVIGLFIWSGFGIETYKINACVSTVSKYVTAEFTSIESGIDVEGNAYTETDSWSESASDVYTETSYNEMPVYPPMPEHDTSFKHETWFDNFRFHTDTNLNVQISNSVNSSNFNENINRAESCIDKLDSYVNVKTWWTITYSSDFK